MAPEPDTEIVGQTATALAEHVRNGGVAPVDVLRAHLAQIGALDAHVGAFQLVRASAALAEAEALSATSDLEKLPLAGVPVAIKDNVAVEGEPTAERLDGNRIARSTPADHELVARLRKAGAIVVGKTRVPELCAAATTDSLFGVSRNPWNLDRTPGGSSGGSTAAVASAMVPIAHGSDGGGSVRIPSTAACGLVGMKPGIGVIPGASGRTGWYGLSSNGPLATTVDDLALLLSVMADRPDLQTVEPPTRQLRIAVSTRPMMSRVVVHPAWAGAAEATAEALRIASQTVTRADPPYDSSMMTTMGVRGMAGIAEDAEGLSLGQLESRNRIPVRLGRTVRRLGLLRDAGRERWRRQTAEFFTDVDVLVTPTLAQPVPRAEGWSRRSWIANVRAADFAMFTGAWNLAGVPAMAVPAGFDGEGMPLSVQLVAAEGGEALLLSVAKQLEALRPWPRHAPIASH